MATKGQNYAVGIGTGAASGAAVGSSILPGWGTAIGAGVGAIGGAIEGAFANSEEAKQRAVLDAQQRRRKKEILYDLLRSQAGGGPWGDTTVADTIMAEKDADWQNASENAQFAAQHRISPNAFVGMAQQGLAAAGRTYNGLSASPTGQTAQTNSPTYPSDFTLTQPSLLSDDAASIGQVGGQNVVGAGTQLPPPDYQLPQYNPARFLRQDQ